MKNKGPIEFIDLLNYRPVEYHPPQFDMSVSRQRIQQLLSEPARSATALGAAAFVSSLPASVADLSQPDTRGTPFSSLIGRRDASSSHTPRSVPTLADLHLQSQEQLHRSAMKYQKTIEYSGQKSDSMQNLGSLHIPSPQRPTSQHQRTTSQQHVISQQPLTSSHSRPTSQQPNTSAHHRTNSQQPMTSEHASPRQHHQSHHTMSSTHSTYNSYRGTESRGVLSRSVFIMDDSTSPARDAVLDDSSIAGIYGHTPGHAHSPNFSIQQTDQPSDDTTEDDSSRDVPQMQLAQPIAVRPKSAASYLHPPKDNLTATYHNQLRTSIQAFKNKNKEWRPYPRPVAPPVDEEPDSERSNQSGSVHAGSTSTGSITSDGINRRCVSAPANRQRSNQRITAITKRSPTPTVVSEPPPEVPPNIKTDPPTATRRARPKSVPPSFVGKPKQYDRLSQFNTYELTEDKVVNCLYGDRPESARLGDSAVAEENLEEYQTDTGTMHRDYARDNQIIATRSTSGIAITGTQLSASTRKPTPRVTPAATRVQPNSKPPVRSTAPVTVSVIEEEKSNVSQSPRSASQPKTVATTSDDQEDGYESEHENYPEPDVEDEQLQNIPQVKLRLDQTDSVYVELPHGDRSRFDFDAGCSDVPDYPYSSVLPPPLQDYNLKEFSPGEKRWKDLLKQCELDVAEEKMFQRLVEIAKLDKQTEDLENNRRERLKSSRGNRCRTPSSSGGLTLNSTVTSTIVNVSQKARQRELEKRCSSDCVQPACVGDCHASQTPEEFIQRCPHCRKTLCLGQCGADCYHGGPTSSRRVQIEVPPPSKPDIRHKMCNVCQCNAAKKAQAINSNNNMLGRPRSGNLTFSRGASMITREVSEGPRIDKLTGTRRRRGRAAIIPGKSFFSQRRNSLTDLTAVDARPKTPSGNKKRSKSAVNRIRRPRTANT